MKSDLDERQRRALQYWYVDGTFEFSMGGICLVLSLYFYAMAKFDGTWISGLLSAIMILVVIGGGYLVNWLVQQMKNRITFPRTGYVEYKRTRGIKRIIRLVIVGAASGLVAALITLAIINYSAEIIVQTSRAYSLNWLPGITGVLIALAAGILAIRMRIMRFFGAAALSIAIGVIVMFIGVGINLGLAIYYGAMGLSLLVAGIFVLRNYLNTTTPPTESDND